MNKMIVALILTTIASVGQAQQAADFCNVEQWGNGNQNEKWKELFCETYDGLKKNSPGTAKKSEKKARKLFESLLDAYVSGPVGTRVLAFTTYFLSVAEQRQGRSDDAAWHWQMAQDLAHDLRQVPEDFPDVDGFLHSHLIEEKRWGILLKRERGEPITEKLDPVNSDVDPELLKTQVSPPVTTYRAKVRRPTGISSQNASGEVVIECFVDKKGILREPAIFKSSGVLVLDVAAMDAVGQWRYKPAMCAGQPIIVFMYPRVEFQK